MRKLLLLLFISFSVHVVNGQIVTVLFQEQFDTGNVSFTSSSDSTGNAPQWDLTDRLFTTPQFADSNFVGASGVLTDRDTSFLTSPKIAITGFPNLSIEFDQINTLEPLDYGKVRVSFDNGPWISLGPATYNGTSFLVPQSDTGFSSLSEAILWRFNDTNFVPNNGSWKREFFNISRLIPTNADTMQFQFMLVDGPTSTMGRFGPFRSWYLDNVQLKGAPCELVPPNIVLSPPANYFDPYIGSVYFTGPYDFTAQITDQSLIDSSYIEWIRIRPGAPNDTFVTNLPNIASSNYQAFLPQANVGDSICWRIVAIDSSGCDNRTTIPVIGYNCFLVKPNIPAGFCQSTPTAIFPYVETFNAVEFVPSTTEPAVLARSWENITGDFSDWLVGENGTPTALTGPT